MATQVQIRKGTTAQHASFTGAVAELSVDTDKKTVVVHDGTTAGGVPLVTNTTTETITGTKTFSNAVFSANPTLSGGTANGVLYLNGSKVATSGSALVFDGTNLGVGTNSPLGKLDARGDLYVGANARILITEGGTGDAVIGGRAGTAFLALTVNGSEQARLTSTGLGIGTSSPATKLDVNGDSTFRNGSGVVLGNIQNSSGWYDFKGSGNTNGTQISSATALPIRFVINGSEVSRFDSSGNLGIGTSSPSAKLDVVNSGVSQIQIKNSSGTTRNTQLMFADNSAVRWRIGMDVATNNNTNIFQLYNDTATAAAFSVDTSGNLGLGVTPSAWRSTTKALQSTAGAIYDFSTTGKGITQNAYLREAPNAWTYINNGPATQYDTGSGTHIWYTAPSGTAGNAISFTQAMTLDSSGNLLVGTTAAAYNTAERVSINGASTKNGIGIAVSGSGAKGIGIYNGNSTGATSGTMLEFQNSSSGVVGSITSNGTATAYNTSSDQRLKENIADADSASTLIDSLQVRKFDWKSDGSHQRYGFVAQELVTVAPEAVHQPTDPEQMMAVDYSKLVPMLVKEIQSLRKRLADAGIA